LVSGRAIITRVPQREQKAELGAASNPHWGHLMVGRHRARGPDSQLHKNSRDYEEGLSHRQFELTARPLIVTDTGARSLAETNDFMVIVAHEIRTFWHQFRSLRKP
jgi:hypothetical protein